MGVQIPHEKGQFWVEGRPLLSIGTFCRELCGGSWTDRFAIWVVDSGGPWKHSSSIVFARWRQCAQFYSYSPGGANVPDDNAVSCAKTVEPIDLPLGLHTRVGQRKHKFSRIRQVASMCPHRRNIGTTWGIQLNRLSAAAVRSYVELLSVQTISALRCWITCFIDWNYHCLPIVSCSSKIQSGLLFWCWLTQVVLEKSR